MGNTSSLDKSHNDSANATAVYDRHDDNPANIPSYVSYLFPYND
jgi:hypothetical protein